MTSIERTAYPRFTRAPSLKELREIYTPTPTDLAFVATTARGPAQKFGLMICSKCTSGWVIFRNRKPSLVRLRFIIVPSVRVFCEHGVVPPLGLLARQEASRG